MPLRFSNLAAQISFWIFFTLFTAAAIGALFFVSKNKIKTAAAGCSAALLFLGIVLICLVPAYPLIYLACFLAAASALGQAFSHKMLSLFLASAGEGLAIVQFCFLYSFSVPAAVVCVILPPLLAAGTLRLFYLVQKSCSELSYRISEIVMRVAGLVFAVIFLVDKVHYAAVLFLAGEAYLIGENAFPKRETFSNRFFKTLFFLLGYLLIFLGLALCVSA